MQVSLLSNLNRSHNQCNVSSIDLEQAFVCRVDVKLESFNSIDFSLTFREVLMTLIISASANFLLRVLFL